MAFPVAWVGLDLQNSGTLTRGTDIPCGVLGVTTVVHFYTSAAGVTAAAAAATTA